MAEICIGDTDAFCLFPLFEDYGLFFTQRHTTATQCRNGNLSDDCIRPVCWVNHPSALVRAEKCGRQALWEHKLNSQAHLKGGMLRDRLQTSLSNSFISNPQTYKSPQWSGKFLQKSLEQELQNFTPPPRAPARLLSAITGRCLAAEDDGKHLRKSVCVLKVWLSTLSR